MSDERKEYEVKGTVTISTEEYRDLLTDKFEAEKSMESYRQRFWDEQTKSSNLKEKVEAQEKSLNHYRDFVNSNESMQTAYKAYLNSKITVEEML